MESFGQLTVRLRPAFDAVTDPKDWRGPIDCVLSPERLEALGGQTTIREAIVHYTSTLPRFELRSDGALRVIADGYRNGPAGP